MKKYFALFYLENNYFLPHFTSVLHELYERDLPFAVLIPEEKSRNKIKQNINSIAYCEENNIEYLLLPQKGIKCEYLFFGNAIHETGVNYKKTVSVFHGCWGGKNVYLRNELTELDIRFVESEFIKQNILEAHSEKEDNMVVVGYTKLDSFKIDESELQSLKELYKLDRNKKTILYAPTFYPSSILKLAHTFPKELSNYNIIVKPHFYIYMRKKYNKELKLIERWNQFDNVYFADISESSLIPFMQVADILVSDFSAAVYEFAAMGKPVVVNRFVKSRWYYKLMPNKLNKRLDLINFDLWEVGDNAYCYEEMISKIKQNLENPNKMAAKRDHLIEKVVGLVDGNVAKRIVNHLIK